MSDTCTCKTNKQKATEYLERATEEYNAVIELIDNSDTIDGQKSFNAGQFEMLLNCICDLIDSVGHILKDKK